MWCLLPYHSVVHQQTCWLLAFSPPPSNVSSCLLYSRGVCLPLSAKRTHWDLSTLYSLKPPVLEAFHCQTHPPNSFALSEDTNMEVF